MSDNANWDAKLIAYRRDAELGIIKLSPPLPADVELLEQLTGILSPETTN